MQPLGIARRLTALRGCAALLATMAAAVSTPVFSEEGFGPMAATAEAQTFRLGTLRVTALHDAQFVVHNDGKVFGVDAGAASVSELLRANALPIDRVTVSVNQLVVRTAGHVVLIDTGMGPAIHGGLMSSLAEGGVSPEEVTDVLITHSHMDHVGGLLGAGGKPAFPQATIRMSTAEWHWMKGQADSADLVKVIEGHVQTFSPGVPVLAGITPIALDGHTPGHVGYEIVSGDQRLLDIGDLAHNSVVSLQRPEWTTQFDGDPATAKATRQTTFARLATTHELVFAPHFPYPGMGYIVTAGEGYAWKPASP